MLSPLFRRLVWLVILFLLIGQVMLFSATGVMGLQRYGSEFHYVLRQSICAVVGVGLMFLLSRIDYQLWAKAAYPIFALQLLMVAATLFSSLAFHAQGASRWLRLGPLSFQPSELAKLTLTLYFAKLLARDQSTQLSWKQWVAAIVPLLVLLFLVYRENDLGGTILLSSLIVGLLFISGMRTLYVAGLLGGGMVFFVYSMLHSEYRRRRVFAFLNPWADPTGSGFQTIQSFLSLHSGKLFGVGLGNGNSKLFFLPEVHTDFIYSLIGEELGFVGAACLLLLFLYFAYLLFKAAFQSRDPLGTYLAFGLGLALILQVSVNLAGVTGILPMKGLPLPFISWGRSALIVDLVMMGILLNIVRQSGIIQPSQSPRSGG